MPYRRRLTSGFGPCADHQAANFSSFSPPAPSEASVAAAAVAPANGEAGNKAGYHTGSAGSGKVTGKSLIGRGRLVRETGMRRFTLTPS